MPGSPKGKKTKPAPGKGVSGAAGPGKGKGPSAYVRPTKVDMAKRKWDRLITYTRKPQSVAGANFHVSSIGYDSLAIC